MNGAVLSLPLKHAGPRQAPQQDTFVPVELSGVTWTIRADLVDELLSAVHDTISGRSAPGTAEIIKTGPHRTVYRLKLPCGNFYLKHFRIADRKALLQNLVRPSKAELEWRAALAVARLGLPTFEPVALGRVCRGGVVRDSFLVSREIPEAIPLDQFATEEAGTAAETGTASGTALPRSASRGRSVVRQKLAVVLGELAGQLHRAGVEHADFHAANILVRVTPDGLPALWLIDLHKMQIRRRLSAPQRCDNLALLHQFFAGKSTRSDRLRFYRAYQRTWKPRAESADRSEIARLERTLSTAAVSGWIRADRAWERGNRHVRVRDAGAGACRGLATLDVAWLESVRDDPECLFRDNCVRWHKQTAKHRVAEIRLPAVSSAPSAVAFFKCIEQTGWWRRWLAPFRRSPVRRSWEVGHALLRRGIDTPRPLVFVERPMSNVRQYYLLTEAIPASVTVAEFLATRWSGMNAVQRRGWLALHLRRLALQMRCLHEAGFDHRDLKFANLLVASDPGDPRIWFLDLDGVRDWRRLPDRRAVQNLSRINVSGLAAGLTGRVDRLRFLKWYLADKFENEWKWWWRGVAQASLKKLAVNRRRGRIVS